MEIIVEHLGAVQFQIRTRGHSIVSEQPVNGDGFDEGMTPPELLLASLGSCAGYYATEYLRKKKLTSQGTTVRVISEKVSKPIPRMTDFVVEVTAPLDLNAEQLKGMEDVVSHCRVHNTLLNPPKIAVKLAGAKALVNK
jgi:putative redox protein